MNLTPSDDQEQLRAATERWLEDNLPIGRPRGQDASAWAQLEDMGWLTVTRDGLDHGTEALLFAELGRFLAPVAMISTAVARRWTSLDGKVALAVGSRLLDPEGASGALGLFERAVGHHVIGPIEARPGLDQLTPIADRGDTRPQPVEGKDAALHLRLLAAAFAVGCAEAAAIMATDYAKLREQFGRPIGAFQAIKHMCVDMAVRAAVARSQLLFAACALDGGEPDRAFHVAAAKRLADDAALMSGGAAIQVHGGIGMTDEAHPHLTLKRAHLLRFVAPVETGELLV